MLTSKTLFLLGCVPARVLLAVLAYKLPEEQLKYFAIPLFLIGASFLYLFLFNKRLDAFEAGGKTWWSQLRPVHGMLYITAALYALHGSRAAAVLLGIDVAFGCAAFLAHHYW